MSGPVFRHRLEVRWGDVDLNGHMRNTAYSEFGTETRLAYLAGQGFPGRRFSELGFGPVIFREESRYLREMALGEVATVDLHLTGLAEDGSHFEFRQVVWREDGERAAVLTVEGAWMDLETRRLVCPPEELRAIFEGLRLPEGCRPLRSVVVGDGSV